MECHFEWHKSVLLVGNRKEIQKMKQYSQWLTAGLLVSVFSIIAGCGTQNLSSYTNKTQDNTVATSTQNAISASISNTSSSDLKNKKSNTVVNSKGTSNDPNHQKLSTPKEYYIEGTVAGAIIKGGKLVHLDINVQKSGNLDSSMKQTPFRTIDNVLDVPIQIDAPMIIKPQMLQKVVAEVTVQTPIGNTTPLSAGSVIRGNLNNFYFDTSGVFKNINGKSFDTNTVKWQNVFIRVN